MDQTNAIPATRKRRDWRFNADVSWWGAIGGVFGGQFLSSWAGVRSVPGKMELTGVAWVVAASIARLVRPDRDRSAILVLLEGAASVAVFCVAFIEGPVRLTGVMPEWIAYGVPPLFILFAFLRIVRRQGKPVMTWRASALTSLAVAIAWAVWGPWMLR